MKDKLGRPLWNDVFMALTFVLKQRSLDPDTKHGCFVINDDHSILSAGYNSPPRGCVDSDIPLTRPEKYKYMVHIMNLIHQMLNQIMVYFI